VGPLERPLPFEAAEGRPESTLGTRRFDLGASVAGLLSSALIPSLFAGLVAVAGLLGGARDPKRPEERAPPEPDPDVLLLEESVLQARFVRFGRDFRNQLPDRPVPVQSAAPPEPSEVPTERTPTSTQPTEHIENRPEDTVDALLRSLDRRAEAFEELERRRDAEGNPDGIEEGTETEGSEGDVYRGLLYTYFREGWTIPTTLPPAEVRRLWLLMKVRIGTSLQISSFEVATPSENPIFDECVIEQLTRLQTEGRPIPTPPEDVADQFVGRTIFVRFRGREAEL
jgi:hypothetical protein